MREAHHNHNKKVVRSTPFQSREAGFFHGGIYYKCLYIM